MEKEISRFIKDIKCLLPTNRKEEKEFFLRTKKVILKEADAEEICTYESCISKFGEPIDIITNYYEEMDGKELINRVRKNNFVKKIFYTISIIIVLLSVFIAGVYYKIYKEAKESMAAGFETVIEEVDITKN